MMRRSCLLLACVLLRPAGAMTAAPPATLAAVCSAVAAIVNERGGSRRCSLSELGDHLKKRGVLLPPGASLSDVVAQADELRLSGPPSGRKVGLAAHATDAALVERIASLLRSQQAPMSSAELRLRLRDERQRVPGLMALLRKHSSVFDVQDGAVRLVGSNDESGDAGGARDGEREGDGMVAASLTRLRALSLPDAMDEEQLAPLAALRDFFVIDLDNQAFVSLERATWHAAEHDDTFILACCSSAHNPRLPQPMAEEMVRLADAGRLRLLSPARDCANAADFVLAFWVGWLHARACDQARFRIVTADSSLEQSVADLLKGRARTVVESKLP